MNLITITLDENGQIDEVLCNGTPPLVLVLDKRVAATQPALTVQSAACDPLQLLAGLAREDAAVCQEQAHQALSQMMHLMHELRLSHTQRQQLLRVARAVGVAAPEAAVDVLASPREG